MIRLETVIYTARTHTSGGRDGTSRSSDGRLDLKLSTPGSAGGGTNPEQLLACGWSACLLSSIRIEAEKRQLALPGPVTIDAEVDLGIAGGARALAVRLHVFLPGVEAEVAKDLLEAACQNSPYCRAVRDNIHVAITLD